MKLGTHQVRLWKKPEAKADPEKDTGPVDPDAQLVAGWTGGENLKTRSVYVGLLMALAAGPVALVLLASGASSAAPPPAAAAAPVVETGGEQAAVGEFAQQFVLAWLGTPRGKETALGGFVDTANLALPEKPVSASQPATAGLRRVGTDTWSVTVGVTVTDVAGVARRYFQVPVRYQAGAMVAAMLPAEVAGPGTAASPDLAYQYTAALSDPVATSASQFLGALLGGSGDVTRYVSPGAAITAVSPPPYSAVRLMEVRTDQDLHKSPQASATQGVVRVFVTAEATVAADQKVTVQYAVTMRLREGRWEVAALDAAPATGTSSHAPSLSSSSSSGAASTSTTAPTSSTTSTPSVPPPAAPTVAPPAPVPGTPAPVPVPTR